MYNPYDEQDNGRRDEQRPVDPIYPGAGGTDITDWESGKDPAENEAGSVNSLRQAGAAPETGAPNESPNDEYHYIRPDQNRAPYSEASYAPAGAARQAVPRYYYAEHDGARKKKEEKPKAGGGFSIGKLIAICLVCALLGGLSGGALVSALLTGEGSSASGAGDSQSGSLDIDGEDDGGVPDPDAEESGSTGTLTSSNVSGDALSASDIYDLACTQVVGITTEITYTNIFGSTSSGAVSGSGFVITSDGYILTNYHVIENAVAGGYDISVMLFNGDTYVASVVGYEDDNDIAVLKIDATGLNPVTFGDSDDMRVGDTVYAVGNPLGELDYTMTSGMVSALDRDITTTDAATGVATTISMFQFDAAVNSGNSGGPVYNSEGQVIGVVTAKYSEEGVEGLGFGVPANDAVYIANQLIENGYVTGKAYFGITVGTVSSSVAEYYNMVEGAYVKAVDSDSCAAAAGLQVGDIITQIDDTPIASREDLVSAKKGYKAGDTAMLTVYRGGESITLTITFDEELPSSAASGQGTEGSGQGGSGGATPDPFGGGGNNPFGW